MLTLTKQKLSLLAVTLLITLMALTRVHHFGNGFSLPDASLVVFFLMGLLSANCWLLGLLLVEAALLDSLAINQFGVSDWCVSPAYLFLIPTYAVMWTAGRFCTDFKALKSSQLVLRSGVLVLATSIAFLISNLSFYALSGRFSEMSLSQYILTTGQYFPAYMSSTLIYVCVLFAATLLFGSLLSNTREHASKSA